MKLFDYLVKKEKEDPNFMFGNAKGQSLFIAYKGYKHMNLFEITEVLRKKYKLEFDFDLGMEKFNSSGKTFVYFKNVYNQE